MARKFSLENAKGERVSLNEDSYFGYNPDGLGISFANAYYGANANFVNTSSGVNQPQFTINILFGANNNNPYKEYYNFVKFLNYQPLVLVYSIEGQGTYRRDCKLSSIPKTEIKDWNTIDEPLTVDFLTPWYQWITMVKGNYTDQKADGKIYINNDLNNNEGFYIYDYVYEEGREKTFFVLNNDSIYFGTSESSPLEITINSGDFAISNPEWRIIYDNKVVQNDRYLIDMPPNSSLVVSSNPQDQKAVLITSDGTVANVYQYQDMTKTNFVSAPIGRSVLHFEKPIRSFSCRMRKEWLVV